MKKMSQNISALKHGCTHCSKKFKYESEKNRHEKSHKPQYDCKVCQKTFSFLYALRRHQKQHERSEPVTCTKCERTFKDEVLLQRHLKYSHSVQSYRCTKCNITFSSNAALRTHSKIHKVQKQNQFQCSYKGCQKSFNFSIHLKHHEFTHTGTKQYYCHICGKGFIQKHHLKTHLKSHEPEQWIKCSVPDCNKKFSNDYALRRHKNTHVRNNKMKFSREKKLYADVEHIRSSISNDEDSYEHFPVVEENLNSKIKIEMDVGKSLKEIKFDVTQSKKVTSIQKNIQDDILRSNEINGCKPSTKSVLSCHENNIVDDTNIKEEKYKTFCDVKYFNALEENLDNCDINVNETIINIKPTMLFDSVINNVSYSEFDNDCRSVLGVCLTSGDGTPDEDCLCAKMNKGNFNKKVDLKANSNDKILCNGTNNYKNREFDNDCRSILGVCLTSGDGTPDEDCLCAKMNKEDLNKNEDLKIEVNNNKNLFNGTNNCSDCSCNDESIRSGVVDKKGECVDNDCRSILGVCLTSGDGLPDDNCLCAKITKNQNESIRKCGDSAITNESVIYKNVRGYPKVVTNGFL